MDLLRHGAMRTGVRRGPRAVYSRLVPAVLHPGKRQPAAEGPPGVPDRVISSPLSAPATGAVRLRGGNAASSRGAASLVKEAIGIARACGCTGLIVGRLDSGYYSVAVIRAIRSAGARFSVTVPRTPAPFPSWCARVPPPAAQLGPDCGSSASLTLQHSSDCGTLSDFVPRSGGLFSSLWAIRVVCRHFWPTVTLERYYRGCFVLFCGGGTGAAAVFSRFGPQSRRGLA